MEIEIHETPLRFHLYGKPASIGEEAIGAVGQRLMDEMWRIVRSSRTDTTGINYWVYMPAGRLFVSVELVPGADAPPELDCCEFELPRYLRHVHIGPYQTLPDKWASLKQKLHDHGESIGPVSLEIYGHHSADPSQHETTILIGLV
ncbi:hypothetical protein LOC68_02670 [Blastopirellula sp. JC732]|uniref:Bacterial transcription activator effector binding domain-containing protein n=1 Tax=Blastopirellula sediminis TaxID=2894196 RepID=A0A9X1MJ61_9BACT|nr:hypothetical protein [Blastopirellula sediminis]MCC9607920.1 hypothetical protein [Blastopirellula sediminis]MCC9627287.1 hypothetical protein [Blastopirellula sediminis]